MLTRQAQRIRSCRNNVLIFFTNIFKVLFQFTKYLVGFSKLELERSFFFDFFVFSVREMGSGRESGSVTAADEETFDVMDTQTVTQSAQKPKVRKRSRCVLVVDRLGLWPKFEHFKKLGTLAPFEPDSGLFLE